METTMKKQIIVDVMDDGEVKIMTKGYTGPMCIEETQFLKDLLGHEVLRQLSTAYYQNCKNKTRKIIPLCG